MLILTRKKGESITIGDMAGNVSLIITLSSTSDGSAKIGLHARPDVAINRSEVYEQIFGHAPTLGERCVDERLPHPATRMTPMDYHQMTHVEIDPVGRHD